MDDATPRLLINKERVGEANAALSRLGLGRGFVFNGDGCYRDVLVQGDCDEGTRQLCGLLGWSDELEALVSESKAASDPAHAKPRI